MKKINLYNKLVINNDEIVIKHSKLKFSVQKIIFYILIIFAIVYSLVLFLVVKEITITTILIVLFMISVVLLYKFYYLKIVTRDFDKDLLIVKNGILSYYKEELVGYLDIPLNLIFLLEDKSYFSENPNNMGSGIWRHKVVLHFYNFKNYYNNLEDKCKHYFDFDKNNNTICLTIDGLGLSHETHNDFIAFIKNNLQGTQNFNNKAKF